MQSAQCHFRATLTNFRSPDVKNVIFGKTAITPSFFLAKDFKSKLELSRTSYRVIPILKSAHFSAQIGKKYLNTVTMVTKILTCYISVTVPDRSIVTIIHT